MLFNSIEFLLFFSIVCVIYFSIPYKIRWLFLLIASYYFYMNWKPTFAILIFVSTLTTYITSLYIEKARGNIKKMKFYLTLSLIFNFGILFIFKYYNFINTSFFTILENTGMRWQVPNLDILLPVGISFYTFQAVGYTIDVYRGEIKAEKHFGIYALFVSFFPQLVAGPIERSKNLLNQLRSNFDFKYDNFIQGFIQMLWGFFIKVCIADRVALYVNAVYKYPEEHNGTTFVLATLLFAIQIYCDFSGYTNIAIGSAKIMGFDLMENFRRPYFSKSIGEFWGRWHISLSTWFRDYLYIPLGGNRVGFVKHIRNLFITFIISGIWHGANWTFVVWGLLHGFFLVFAILRDKYIDIALENSYFKKIKNIFNILITFSLVAFAWVFFRADNISDAMLILNKIFTQHGSLFLNKSELAYAFVCILILFFKEFKDEYNYKINFLSSKNKYVQYFSIVMIIYIIILFGVVDSNQFIYFQF